MVEVGQSPFVVNQHILLMVVIKLLLILMVDIGQSPFVVNQHILLMVVFKLLLMVDISQYLRSLIEYYKLFILFISIFMKI